MLQPALAVVQQVGFSNGTHMDPGIQSALGQSTTNTLPVSWLGRADAPPVPPIWANIKVLTNTQVRNLQSQIAYDLSGWDYSKIGADNQLGRYQFSSQILEVYGLLTPGSNLHYGTDSVNYRNCWNPIYINTGINVYQNYFYNVTGLSNFLTTKTAQEHLAYQRIVDLYLTGLDAGIIGLDDSADTVAGMIYVAWTLSVGAGPTAASPMGTGAWAWRYNNIGNGAAAYNGGRYAVAVLSQ